MALLKQFYKVRYRSLSTILLGLLASTLSLAQTDAWSRLRPVQAAVPSLQIAPDARSGGMGDQGVATTADPYAQYWNAAKYAFLPSRSTLGISYTPWMSRLVSDVALIQAVGHHQIDKEGKHALGASLRYFSIGEMTIWDDLGNTLGHVRPSEMALDISYVHKFSPTYSMAVALRYIHANQGALEDLGSGYAIAGDLTGYMQRPIRIASHDFTWTAGFALRNIGSKLTFEDCYTTFIPTTLALGTGLVYDLDETNRFSASVELSKLLVPMLPYRESYQTTEEHTQALLDYRAMSGLSGIFHSFTDAPDGFSEELKEVRWSIGAEYSYEDKFFARLGYSYLHPDKGNLQALSLGAGFKAKGIRLDASYMISTIQHNPLDQTLRFSLALDLDGVRGWFK